MAGQRIAAGDACRFRVAYSLLRSLLDEMQTGAVVLFPLFDRENSAAKVGELDQFVLDFLQPFKPLAVSDLSRRFVAAVKPILVIQLFEVSDLVAETSDFFAKHG
jgi:hypothetical protein